jgi:two-component system sensor histidine kinase ArlS
MRNWWNTINAVPLKWRFTLWSSVFIAVLFIGYSNTQYRILNKWALNQEELTLHKTLDDIQGYYADQTSLDLGSSRNFLGKVNQGNQLIRILDRSGNPLLTISNNVPGQWVTPEPVNKRQLIPIWHAEDHLLVLRSPLLIGSFAGTIEIARNLENYEKLNHIMSVILAVGGLIGVTIGIIGAVLLARQFIKPIARLTGTMSRITHSGLTERVDFIANKDELSLLSQMFNEMMDRLEASFQQQRQFVEDASHELRTPIAIIEGHLAMLQRWGKHDPAILDESLNASLTELIRLKRLSNELLTLSRAEAMTARAGEELSDPLVTVKQVIDDYTMLHPDVIIESDMQPLDGIELVISSDHWKQILIILMDNAVNYSADRKLIRLNGRLLPDKKAELEITDHGIGIPKAEINYVFDRFYRVDKARSRGMGGNGLGLAIAKRLIETYGGTIAIASEENKGTVVTLTLPLELQQE